MTKGGKRKGAGRKKIGAIINTRIDEKILDQIEKNIDGKSRAEKIRKCLELGLKYKINGGDKNE